MIEACGNCGGVYGTEDMELVAGTPCRCGKRPCCPDFLTQIEKVNAPIMLQSVRSGFVWKYEGKPFVHCPWCGKKLR